VYVWFFVSSAKCADRLGCMSGIKRHEIKTPHVKNRLNTHQNLTMDAF
jgi:hypothetical protein